MLFVPLVDRLAEFPPRTVAAALAVLAVLAVLVVRVVRRVGGLRAT